MLAHIVCVGVKGAPEAFTYKTSNLTFLSDCSPGKSIVTFSEKVTWKRYFQKFPGAQLGEILDYFRLRSQMSPERIETVQTENGFINCSPSHFWRKQIWRTLLR